MVVLVLVSALVFADGVGVRWLVFGFGVINSGVGSGVDGNGAVRR